MIQLTAEAVWRAFCRECKWRLCGGGCYRVMREKCEACPEKMCPVGCEKKPTFATCPVVAGAEAVADV